MSSFLLMLTVLHSADQVFCRLSLIWDLSDVFPKFRQGVMSLGEEDHRGKVSFLLYHKKVLYLAVECPPNSSLHRTSGCDLIWKIGSLLM